MSHPPTPGAADPAPEHGGVVFEVHPSFVDGEPEKVAVPCVKAHLDALDRSRAGVSPGRAGEPGTTDASTR
ncbi:hypothetical protein AB0M97_11980 [Streptomyces sp. NPDC051207]|uniref:hypothetical protein n=1 Tax=Streptomyces sp. NPDC051207 TaxID=3154641 RepID=UPI003431371E